MAASVCRHRLFTEFVSSCLVSGSNFQDIDEAVGRYVDRHLNPADGASLYASVVRVNESLRTAVIAGTGVASVIEKTIVDVILGGEPRIPVDPDSAEMNFVRYGFARVLRNTRDVWADEPIAFLAVWTWINSNPKGDGEQS